MEPRRETGTGDVPGGGRGGGKAQASAGSLVLRILKDLEFINSDENNIEYLPKKKLSRSS